MSMSLFLSRKSLRMKVELAAIVWFLRLLDRAGQKSNHVTSTYQCEVVCDCSVDEPHLIALLCGLSIALALVVVTLACALVNSRRTVNHEVVSPRRKGGGFVQMPSRPTCSCVLQ